MRGERASTEFASDIYSLGVILYELLCGRLPFEGVNGAVLFTRILAEEPPLPPSHHRPGLDPRLDAVCLKAIAKRPHDRYDTMAAFAGAERLSAMRPAPDAASGGSRAAVKR